MVSSQAKMRKKKKQKRVPSIVINLRDFDAGGSSNADAAQLPVGVMSTQARLGVVLGDGCESASTNAEIAPVWHGSGNAPAQAELVSVESGSEQKRQERGFNDLFPDEILLHVFKHCWRPTDCWESAMVCKRWCVLRACTHLRKQSAHRFTGHVPCISSLRTAEGRRRKSKLCSGSSSVLKLHEFETDWKLALDLLMSCKRHTHSLMIKDCTRISERGYNLISEFAFNLRSLKLESCVSMDDTTLGLILDRCFSLRSLHLSSVPKLTLKNVEKKASRLQELRVYGCNLVPPATIVSLLLGCSQLKILCLSAMEGHGAVVTKPEPSTSKLHTLELSNSFAVTPELLPALKSMLPNLRKLHLSDCPGLSDGTLKDLIASCGSRLQKLVVTRCFRVSDESVRSLASVATDLQDLCLAGTSAGDDGLRALMESKEVISRLRNLSLARCPEVTDEGLKYFMSARPRLVSLKSLDVQNCSGVSATMLTALENATKEDRDKWSLVRARVTVP